MNLMATKWLAQGTQYYIEISNTDSEGNHLFAVRGPLGCLNKDGEWEDEPLPSNRNESFNNRCRWADFSRASTSLERYCT